MQILKTLPRPVADEVHIHCVTLATGAARYISSDELLRAERLLDPLKKDHFITCRGLLREILGRYLSVQPEALFFSEGEHGKPYLCGSTFNSTQLHFNLSHSGTLFLLAVAADREVGIDVELIRQDIPLSDMARLAFSPREQEELFALSEHQQRNAFYRCWTRKEAYLKACGMGFDLQSNSFSVSLFPGPPVSLFAPASSSHWLLQEIPVPEDYCAALAVKGSSPVICTILNSVSSRM